ncbi:HAD family hydrolase [Roseobacteraceae bacterium S113]
MYATLHHQGQARRLHNTLWRDAISRLGAQGAIFDCDGTLVHSAEAHYQCMNDAAREQGVEMARAWYVARGGLDRRSLFEAFGRERAPDLNVAQAIETSIARFSEHVSLVRPIEATRDLFQALAGAGIKTAVATNAERSVADLSLTKAGMRAQVGWLVSISDGLPQASAASV